MIIVIAWTEEGSEITEPGRPDLGILPLFRTVAVPRAVTWVLDGTADDLRKAEEHAQTRGHKVFTYPMDEPDPLGRARADVLPKPKEAPKRKPRPKVVRKIEERTGPVLCDRPHVSGFGQCTCGFRPVEKSDVE